MLHGLPDLNNIFSGPGIAAPDVQALRDAITQLARAARRGRGGFVSFTGREPADYADDKHRPTWILRGALQYRVGNTNATIVLDCTKKANETYSITFDGVEVATGAIAGGVQTVTIPVTGRGWLDEQCVAVRVVITNAVVRTSGGSYMVRDAYTGPLGGGVGFAWPGIPAFDANPNGSPNRAKAIQLANCVVWLARRLEWARDPVGQLLTWFVGPDGAGAKNHNPLNLWTGSIARANDLNSLVAQLYVQCGYNAAERVRMWSGGTLLAQSDVFSAGFSDFITLTGDLSAFATNTVVPIRIETNVITANAGETTKFGSRFSLSSVALGEPSSYTIGAVTPKVVPEQSMNWTAMANYLNALGAAAQAIYDRIILAPDIFNVQRMATMRNAPDEGLNTALQRLFVTGDPHMPPSLWVTGKGVSLGYGGATIKPPEKDARVSAPYEYSFAHEDSVIGTDKADTVFLSASNYPALPIGAPFALLGDVAGAWKVWR